MATSFMSHLLDKSYSKIGNSDYESEIIFFCFSAFGLI